MPAQEAVATTRRRVLRPSATAPAIPDQTSDLIASSTAVAVAASRLRAASASQAARAHGLSSSSHATAFGAASASGSSVGATTTAPTATTATPSTAGTYSSAFFGALSSRSRDGWTKHQQQQQLQYEPSTDNQQCELEATDEPASVHLHQDRVRRHTTARASSRRDPSEMELNEGTRNYEDVEKGVYEYVEQVLDWDEDDDNSHRNGHRRRRKHGKHHAGRPIRLCGWLLRKEGLWRRRYRKRFCVFKAENSTLFIYADDNTINGKVMAKLVLTRVQVFKNSQNMVATGFVKSKDLTLTSSFQSQRSFHSGSNTRSTSSNNFAMSQMSQSSYLSSANRRHHPDLKEEFLRPVSEESFRVWTHCFKHHMRATNLDTSNQDQDLYDDYGSFVYEVVDDSKPPETLPLPLTSNPSFDQQPISNSPDAKAKAAAYRLGSPEKLQGSRSRGLSQHHSSQSVAKLSALPSSSSSASMSLSPPSNNHLRPCQSVVQPSSAVPTVAAPVSVSPAPVAAITDQQQQEAQLNKSCHLAPPRCDRDDNSRINVFLKLDTTVLRSSDEEDEFSHTYDDNNLLGSQITSNRNRLLRFSHKYSSKSSSFQEYDTPVPVSGSAPATPDSASTSASTPSSPVERIDRCSIIEEDEVVALRVDFSDVEKLKLLPSTSTSHQLWLAKLKKKDQVVLKHLRLDKPDQSSDKAIKKRFEQEIRILSRLQHAKVVFFRGVAWSSESDVSMLMEYMPNGDLRTYFESVQRCERWTKRQLRLAIDIIEALVYIHSLSPKLLHRELSSENIFLTSDMRAKVGGFGSAKYSSSSRDGSRILPSANCLEDSQVHWSRWTAPEVLTGKRRFTEASDIYAFGIILSEIDTHEKPFDDLVAKEFEGQQVQEVDEAQVLQKVIENKWKPSFSKSCPLVIRALANECLAFDPLKRPPTLDVAYRLRRAVEVMPELVEHQTVLKQK